MATDAKIPSERLRKQYGSTESPLDAILTKARAKSLECLSRWHRLHQIQHRSAHLAVLILAALVVSIFSTDVSAQQKKAGDMMIYSFSETSCGAWMRARGKRNEQVYLYWLRGFVSGYNYGNEQYVVVKMPDMDTLALYVDKKCSDDPLMDFPQAALGSSRKAV